ncbi:MAG: hypothetical protein ACLSA6_06950 [Holdemania massiliensis]
MVGLVLISHGKMAEGIGLFVELFVPGYRSWKSVRCVRIIHRRNFMISCCRRLRRLTAATAF